MASVHSIEEASIARLREQLGATAEERDHLLAFARGHSGAVASIHNAVLALFDASDNDLIDTVIRVWPKILGVDSAALVLGGEGGAILASSSGLGPLDPVLVRGALGRFGLIMRSVDHGHPYFGHEAVDIRAEAIIRFDCRDRNCWGILLLGQKAALPVDPKRGGELLQFLATSLGAMIDRWTGPTNN